MWAHRSTHATHRSGAKVWPTGGGATQVDLSSNHTPVVSGTYSATTNGAVIRLKDNSSLVCDSWGPTLQSRPAAWL